MIRWDRLHTPRIASVACLPTKAREQGLRMEAVIVSILFVLALGLRESNGQASSIDSFGLEIEMWLESDDPSARVAGLLQLAEQSHMAERFRDVENRVRTGLKDNDGRVAIAALKVVEMLQLVGLAGECSNLVSERETGKGENATPVWVMAGNTLCGLIEKQAPDFAVVDSSESIPLLREKIDQAGLRGYFVIPKTDERFKGLANNDQRRIEVLGGSGASMFESLPMLAGVRIYLFARSSFAVSQDPGSALGSVFMSRNGTVSANVDCMKSATHVSCYYSRRLGTGIEMAQLGETREIHVAEEDYVESEIDQEPLTGYAAIICAAFPSNQCEEFILNKLKVKLSSEDKVSAAQVAAVLIKSEYLPSLDEALKALGAIDEKEVDEILTGLEMRISNEMRASLKATTSEAQKRERRVALKIVSLSEAAR